LRIEGGSWVAYVAAMKPQFTAITFKEDDMYVGWCPEVKGANGQGTTREECLKDIAAAVETMLEYYREEGMKEAPAHAERTPLALA